MLSYYKCFFLFLMLTSAHFIFARHIVSGTMGYKCLGDNEYKVKMYLYRDCTCTNCAFLDDPVSISIYDNFNMLLKVLEISLSDRTDIESAPYENCPANFSGYCVERGLYEFTTELPLDEMDYIFTYQRCCWSEIMTNMKNPSDQGITVTTTISAAAREVCNNRPVIDYPLSVAACPNEPVTLSLPLYDAEDDSLTYELCLPLQGG